MIKQKDQSVETLRGLAILLVIAGDIIRDDTNPIAIARPSFFVSLLQYLELTLSTIRMPLFTVISGYLYAASPAAADSFKKLISGKARRILIPFFSVSTIQVIVFSLFTVSGYSLTQIPKFYIWPDQHLWFLAAVFQIFIMVGLLDVFKLLDSSKKYLAVCLLTFIPHVAFGLPKILALSGVNYLLPFFLLGYGLRRYPDLFVTRKNLPLFIIVFLLSFSIKPAYLAVYQQLIENHSFRRMAGIAAAFTGIPLIFYFRKPVRWLAFIGYYAFGLYLFHRISVLFIRSLFQTLSIQNPYAIFFGYLIGGILIALIMQLFLERFSFTRIWILGLKKNEKIKKPKEVIADLFSSRSTR